MNETNNKNKFNIMPNISIEIIIKKNFKNYITYYITHLMQSILLYEV